MFEHMTRRENFYIARWILVDMSVMCNFSSITARYKTHTKSGWRMWIKSLWKAAFLTSTCSNNNISWNKSINWNNDTLFYRVHVQHKIRLSLPIAPELCLASFAPAASVLTISRWGPNAESELHLQRESLKAAQVPWCGDFKRSQLGCGLQTNWCNSCSNMVSSWNQGFMLYKRWQFDLLEKDGGDP